jgi:hypothetical protein
MNKEDYPKCRTCKHYRRWSSLGGKCTAITQYTDIATVYTDATRSETRLMVEPEFGCVLHEPITTDSQ